MSNWLWVVLGLGALALFVFSRAGCGMRHGGHAHRSRDDGNQDRQGEATTGPLQTSANVDSGRAVPQPEGHAHGAPSVTQGTLAAEDAGRSGRSQQAEPRRHRHGC